MTTHGSYASVAAHNAPPPSQQPQPNPALLEGQGSSAQSIGVNHHHGTETDRPDVDHKLNVVPSAWSGETTFHSDLSSDAEALKQRASTEASSAKSSASKSSKDLESDAKAFASKAEASAKKYGSQAEASAKKYGDQAGEEARKLSRQGKKELSKPEVQAGIAGVVNVVALVGVGMLAYRHWHDRRWDRRAVTGIVVGLGALFGSQGYLGWLFYGDGKNRK